MQLFPPTRALYLRRRRNDLFPESFARRLKRHRGYSADPCQGSTTSIVSISTHVRSLFPTYRLRQPALLALLLCIGYAPLDAQTLTFKSLVHDFGTVRQKAAVNCEFEYTNTGKDTAYIMQPRPSCGCTAAILSNAIVAPRQSGKIGVEYHTYAGTMGVVEKTITVIQRVNGEERNAGVLTIRANVVGEVIPDTSMLRFTATAGERVKMTLALKSNSDVALKLDNVSVAITEYADTTAGQAYHSDKVTAKALTDYSIAVGQDELRPGETASITLEVQTRIKGQMNGSIRIALPNSEVRIPVVGVVYYNKSPGK